MVIWIVRTRWVGRGSKAWQPGSPRPHLGSLRCNELKAPTAVTASASAGDSRKHSCWHDDVATQAGIMDRLEHSVTILIHILRRLGWLCWPCTVARLSRCMHLFKRPK